MRPGKISRFVSVFMCFVLIFSGTAFAQLSDAPLDPTFDKENAIIAGLKRLRPTVKFLQEAYGAYKFAKGVAEALGIIKSDLQVVKEEIIAEFKDILQQEQRQRIQGNVGAAVDALNAIRNNPQNPENVRDAGINLPFARGAWNEISQIIFDTDPEDPQDRDHVYRLAPAFNVAAVTILLLEKVKDEISDKVQTTLQYNYKMVGADSIYVPDCKRLGTCHEFRTDASLDSILWKQAIDAEAKPLSPYPVTECKEDPDQLPGLDIVFDIPFSRSQRTLVESGGQYFIRSAPPGFEGAFPLVAHAVCDPNSYTFSSSESPAMCWFHPYTACTRFDSQPDCAVNPPPFRPDFPFLGPGVPINTELVPNCYNTAVSRAVAQFNSDETITLIKEAMLKATQAGVQRVTDDGVPAFGPEKVPVCVLNASFQFDPPPAGISRRPRTLCEIQVDAETRCDINRDGVIDRNDINAIFAARGTVAAPDDLRDVDQDGRITVADARSCALLCTNPDCAP